MNTLYATLLGAIQGASEFLPISSSGHLQLFKTALQLGDIPILYDALLHMATLLVIVFAMRRPLIATLQAVFSQSALNRKEYQNILFAVAISLIPTAVIGLVIDQFLLPLPLVVVGLCFLVTGLVLFCSRYARSRRNYISIAHALAIGIVHGCTVMPGISRAGTTIVFMLLLGYSEKIAIRVSFFSAIPVMIGALILKLRDFESLNNFLSPIHIAAGCLVALGVGTLSYQFLQKLVHRQKLHYFSLYLLLIGVGTVLLSIMSVRS